MAKNLGKIAGEWAELYREVHKLKAKMKPLGKELMDEMINAKVERVDLGNDKFVIIATDKKKDPSKGDIVAYFGEEATEKFWKRLPDKVSSYPTIAKIRDKKEVEV